MLAIDIMGFNDPRRGADVQLFLRAAMYELLTCAFHASLVAWRMCHCEDRGDGVLVVAAGGTSAATLFDPLADHVRAGIRLHNKLCSDIARIRLRMSVHAGQVLFDEHGVCGPAVTHLFRMLEAAAFKRALAGSGADFALLTSDALYQEVISQGPGLIDPDMFAPINIRCKETRGRAWLYLPPVRNPFLGSVSGIRPQAPRSDRVANGNRARPSTPVLWPAAPAAGNDRPTAGNDRPVTRIPRQRAARPQDARTKDLVPALAGLIAAGAATTRSRLASVPRSSSVPGRLRERVHPGQRAQQVGT